MTVNLCSDSLKGIREKYDSLRELGTKKRDRSSRRRLQVGSRHDGWRPILLEYKSKRGAAAGYKSADSWEESVSALDLALVHGAATPTDLPTPSREPLTCLDLVGPADLRDLRVTWKPPQWGARVTPAPEVTTRGAGGKGESGVGETASGGSAVPAPTGPTLPGKSHSAAEGSQPGAGEPEGEEAALPSDRRRDGPTRKTTSLKNGRELGPSEVRAQAATSITKAARTRMAKLMEKRVVAADLLARVMRKRLDRKRYYAAKYIQSCFYRLGGSDSHPNLRAKNGRSRQ